MMAANWRKACGKAIIPAEREWLRAIAAEVEAGFGASTVIVNIGIFRGATMYCMRAGAPNARMVGIDIAYPQGVRLNPGLRAEVIVADSGKCYKAFKTPVHLLFIDGDHSYRGVWADIRGWTPKVPVGGIVAFHDCDTEPRVAAKHVGVRKSVMEWMRLFHWHQIPAAGSIWAFRRPRCK